jgi:hypothetical protein
MFLSYLALAILIIMIIVIVYAFIWVHDIPYMLAKKRNHPNLHAIHIACWLSLFTLHALWPFVFLWAIIQKPKFEVVIVEGDVVAPGATDGAPGVAGGGGKKSIDAADTATLRKTIADLQQRLDALERRAPGSTATSGGGVKS